MEKKTSIRKALAAAVLALCLLLCSCSGKVEVDTSREPSRGLSFDKTSITSRTYTLVGIGLCKDRDIVVQGTKDGMPVTSVGEMAFRGNNSIRSIVLPASITNIGSSAFAYCKGLRAIVFLGGIAHIQNSAFRYCTGLTEITLPRSVISIGESAFSHCTALTKIYFGGTMEDWDDIEFGEHWNVYMPEYTVYCTDGEIFVDLYSKYR